MSLMSKDKLFVNSEKTEFFVVGRRRQLKRRILTECLLALRTFKFLAAEVLVKNLGVWLDNSEGALGRGYPILRYFKKNRQILKCCVKN